MLANDTINKSPRQLGEQAVVFYAAHRDIAEKLAVIPFEIELKAEKAEAVSLLAGQEENGRQFRGGVFRERIISMHYERDLAFEGLGSAITSERSLQAQYEANIEKAAAHFKDNQESYHNLAVIEASLDGVQIKVRHA